MGRVALGQRELFGKRSERHSPGNYAFFSGHLEQTIEAPGNGVGEGEVVDRRESDRVPCLNVGTDNGTDGDAGIAGFRGSEESMVKRPSSGCPSLAETYTPLDSRIVRSSRVSAERSCSYVLPSTRRPMERRNAWSVKLMMPSSGAPASW